ncbi:MAG: hypothetical protein OEN23_18880 [Paracoccaceae bacterium]|nr:hypothetical protein [Paracoccaceae bacterium]
MFLPIVAAAAISATPAIAKPVNTAIMADRELHPTITVRQETDELGRLRYSRIEEDFITIVPLAYGKCGHNYRVRRAFISNWFAPYDGGYDSSLEVFPSGDFWSRNFPVNTSKRTFGPHFEFLEIPTFWLTDSLTQFGEQTVAQTAGALGTSLTQERAKTFAVPVEIQLSFYMICRRYAGSSDKSFTKSVRSTFLIIPEFVGATSSGSGGLIPVPDPGEQPSSPIPVDGGLTERVRVESASLLILPEEKELSCRLHLSATFRTTGSATVTYQLVDALGARSPEFQVDVDHAGVAFASHEVDLEASGTNVMSFEAFTVGENAEGPGFGGVLQDEPSDRERGYYRIETIQPHRTFSNIAGYNLDECVAEGGFRNLVFEAFIVDDPKRIGEEPGDLYSKPLLPKPRRYQ